MMETLPHKCPGSQAFRVVRSREVRDLGVGDRDAPIWHDAPPMSAAVGDRAIRKRVVVAIDGPAGAGKTTVARRLARRLGLPLLDTGAIYRTLALVASRRGIAWDDEARLVTLCRDFPIRFDPLDLEAPEDAPQRVFFADEEVTTAIRTSEVSRGASKVSALPGVRAALLGIQRALGATGCVAEGRDMGTVVFPDAAHKFFVTADVRTRAQRRLEDLRRLTGEGPIPQIEEVERDIEERDLRDSSRETAPLAKAADAVLVDTSGLDADAVLERVLRLVVAG
jgi:CMP/dCMP kinase